MREVASKHGWCCEERLFTHSQTRSFELKEAGKKVFSFQISPRDIQLEPALASAWHPVQIETFRDNLGSKMSALVGRGAPRDFLDVHAVCTRGLTTIAECWQTWQCKNPGLDAVQARMTVLEHLASLESRRPLERIRAEAEKAAAAAVRAWFKTTFCKKVEE